MRGSRAAVTLIAVTLLAPLLGCQGDQSFGPAPQPICDRDGDGYLADDPDCAGTDCDDLDPSVSPGEREACDDQRDNNCDDLVDCLDPACLPERVVMTLQDGAPQEVLSNIREDCWDRIQIQIDNRCLSSSPFEDVILRAIEITYRQAAPWEPGSCPTRPEEVPFRQIVFAGETLRIDNFLVTFPEQKTGELASPPHPFTCIATLRARLESVQGTPFSPEPLEALVTVDDFPPRVPPCPSYR